MSTRSLTRVFDARGREVVCMYVHCDGYPSGVGADLAEFLIPMRVVNGISGSTENLANGMGCLAAQLVDHFKDEVGNVYLYAPGINDCGEEYEYHVKPAGESTALSVFDVPFDAKKPKKLLFDGAPSAFAEWLEKYEAESENE